MTQCKSTKYKIIDNKNETKKKKAAVIQMQTNLKYHFERTL